MIIGIAVSGKSKQISIFFSNYCLVMGNRESAEKAPTTAVLADQRRPDDDSTYTIYNLVDQHGGGELIPWMRFAIKTGDETMIDEYLETKVGEKKTGNEKNFVT